MITQARAVADVILTAVDAVGGAGSAMPTG
jgi:hypothetical protein